MSQPIRVLQIVTQMHRAGLETMLMNYYRHTDREKVQFDFLVHREGEYDYDDEIQQLGGRIFHVSPITARDFPKYLKALDNFFVQHKEYKIVHCHLDALSGLALRAAKKAGVACRIAHSHNNGFDKDKKLLLRYAAKRMIPHVATHFWGCSGEALAFMFGEDIVRTQDAKIIPNAVDLNCFAYDEQKRVEYRKELGLENSYVIGHIGRFSYQKNHSFLIDVFNVAKSYNANAKLLLIGFGEDEASIQKKVQALGLKRDVLFLGARSDIPALLSTMDVFVLPSHFEGFGMVLLEAQAAGLRCVTSDTVAKCVNVTGKVEFLSLSAGAHKWAEIVLASGRRYNDMGLLQSAEYDISSAAVRLQNEYLALLNS